MVLIISLLLLVVVTILAVGMFRSFGIDEKIAGNIREKQLALNAAETAEQFAESWLNQGLGTAPVACTGMVTASVGQVCNATLQASGLKPEQVPWAIAGAPVGVTYTPPSPAGGATIQKKNDGNGGFNSYWADPVFYIAYLGQPAGSTTGQVYQINAVGYGGSPNTVAVVETTYSIQSNAAVNLGDNSR